MLLVLTLHSLPVTSEKWMVLSVEHWLHFYCNTTDRRWQTN